MQKLILDVMGGDNAPRAILEGAIKALPELRGELVLLGDEKVITPLLAKHHFQPLAEALRLGHWPRPAGKHAPCKVTLIHAPENIEMGDTIRAIRRKPNASINVGCLEAGRVYKATSGDSASAPAAFISAGHSGAVMASALVQMGRLPEIERPAIAVRLPTLSANGCVLIDVGANVDCKPEHLRDFAIMGALYGQVERSTPGLPRVGVLSNGEEKSKGTELTRTACKLIEQLPCFQKGPGAVGEFIGYVEGKEIFKGGVDVVVTDGFVGNVVLKSIEGLGSAVTTLLKDSAKTNLFAILGFLLSASVFRRLKRKLDYAEYGAAPLLGVAGYVFICHGRSDSRAMKNALLRAQTALQDRFVERLERALVTTIETGDSSSV